MKHKIESYTRPGLRRGIENMITIVKDCFGHEYSNLDDFRPPRVIANFPILDGQGSYLGMLFFMDGLKVGRVWTHSLMSHGREPFATEEKAKADFFETSRRSER